MSTVFGHVFYPKHGQQSGESGRLPTILKRLSYLILNYLSDKRFRSSVVEKELAEREGFEPPIALRLCLISSQVHSTGLCHLSAL